MLTPDYLEKLPDEITKLYEQIEQDIISDMARRIVKADYVTDTAAWQYERMRMSGAAHDYILRQLQRKTGRTYKELEKLFEDTVGTALQTDDKIYKEAGLSPPRLRDSPELLQIIESGLNNTLGLFQNLTRTTASAGQQQFVTALDRAWLQITSGAFDYQTAIRRAIRDIAASGLHAIRYPSGRVDKLDVATRRAALTGVSQTAGKISLARAQQMGARFMELTAHAGARPSHAAWQGQVVSLEGAPGYLSLDDIGYGTGGGFKGWNCRHDWFPFFPGISESAYPRSELERLNNATVPYQGKDVPVYEATQKQRAMERKIRESKREVSALDAARQTNTKLNLDADFNRAAMELKRREAALKGYLKETGLDRDRSREQVQGFGRSQSSKAVWANRKELEKYTSYRYNKKGTIIVTDDWKNKGKVTIPKDYKPFAVIETQETKSGIPQSNRAIYDKNGRMLKQIHSGSHGNPKHHNYGANGEHGHNFYWDGSKLLNKTTRDLTDEEQIENADILGVKIK